MDSNSHQYSNEKSSLQVNPEFSVRIVVCDHYLTKPVPGIDVIYSEFRGSNIKQVPVLRIFGSTPNGRKACLHVHGVFPYFYIPCPTSNPEPRHLYQIAASLDKALNIALKQATSANQHVYKITLVKGLPFYGFHDKDHLYLKIFLYNPGLIKQAVDLCSNGAILGQSLQPHESHLSFNLQFFIDFNLFGMSNIDLEKVKHRRPDLSQKSNEPLGSPEEFILKPESICFYEADCVASHIINRQRVGKGDGIENPGLEEVWNQELERRKQLNVTMASKSLSQGRINTDDTESHYRFEKMFLMKISDLTDKPVNVGIQNIKNLEIINYPAETLDGSQLFNATDVSTHLQENIFNSSTNKTLRNSTDNEIIDDIDNTLVDEDIALNSSFSFDYSQVPLDSDDLELVDMLQDLDERPIEEDSIMGTPANADEEDIIEIDHAEYSQIFDENTICLEPSKGNDDNKDSLSWDDSFWDGVNIPQLDGTYDEEPVKKVKNRKMTTFKLGLSKSKSKNKSDLKNNISATSENNTELNKIISCVDNIVKEPDDTTLTQVGTLPIADGEINVMNENQQHDNKSINENVIEENQNELNDSLNIIDTSINTEIVYEEITKNKIYKKQTISNEDSFVNVVHDKSNMKNISEGPVTSYDLQNQYKPIPGPSNRNITGIQNSSPPAFLSDSFDSSPENENLGIESFYNTSKLFDCSIDETPKSIMPDNNTSENVNTSRFTVKSEMKINNASGNTENNPEVTQYVYDIKTSNDVRVFTPKIKPPSTNYVKSTLDKFLIPHNKYPEPYYSNHKDVGNKIELGQLILKLTSRLAKDQKPFEKVLNTVSIEEWRQLLFSQTNEILEDSVKPSELIQLLASNKEYIMKPLRQAPTTREVLQYLERKQEESSKYTDDNYNNLDTKEISKTIDDLDGSQAIGLNEDEVNVSISLESADKDKNDLNSSLQVSMQPDGSFLCFGKSMSQKECLNDPSTIEVDFLTLMLVEVHTSVRGDLNPDPSLDVIQAIFITITNQCPPNHFHERNLTLILVVDDKSPPKVLDRCVFNYRVLYLSNESKMLEELVNLVQQHDPDIMCGYEIEMNSWGYVFERAQALGLEIVKDLSRITEKYRQKRWKTDDNEFEGKIIGRITFNVWRLFRHELALSSYSFESCMYEILKERVPKYSYKQLSEWWECETRMLTWITVEYYLTKLSGTVRMLEKLDIINRTSELARLFGLQWWEVLSRGSQFRVESLMLRAARPLNLVALSPTVKQRAAMRAPECLPLIFEPESRFYTDPIIVLDFQSLYPSMMIAYNYCFSTCVGRVQNIDGNSHYEFGAWRLRIPKAKLQALQSKGLVHWSPVGAGFVRPAVRRGVLPALLRRILAARQAVKKGMKLQSDEAVRKAMHSRQLGLKLIANVTYGYTAANFSGRMPCVEVGDSVVAKGRETLERAIALVRGNAQWNAKVVYGDTDSMFVLVAGASRARAFRVGQQIADAVTADNPSPVALKLEKVYQPCILQTKKRYVGYMYESADQEKPVYEAKGIETVRRDGCPAGVKLLQRSLCELFSSGDVSRVRRLVAAQLARLAEGALPPLELVFTREYHGPAGYRPGAAAPPHEIAKRMRARDPRSAPRAGERVPWLVAAGAPGAALVRLARAPRELAAEPRAPHVGYYAARVLLPPLHRCLSLLGVDVFKWWRELGWSREAAGGEGAGGGIARYMERGRCATCGARGARSVCGGCAARPAAAAAALAARAARASADLQRCREICASCCGHGQWAACDNTECPALWRRGAARLARARLRDVLDNLPPPLNDQMFQF